MYEQINQQVSQCVPFTMAELAIFNQLLLEKNAPRKSFLLRESEVCRFEAFIVKGCARSFCLDESGHETILNFTVEDWWLSDIGSFHEQQPSRMYIETLEDCQLLYLTPQTKEELLRQAPRFERFFRLMLQRHLSALQDRLVANISRPARERYHAFLEKYPGLARRVPQHMIASYLGISPEFLSKIRRG